MVSRSTKGRGGGGMVPRRGMKGRGEGGMVARKDMKGKGGGRMVSRKDMKGKGGGRMEARSMKGRGDDGMVARRSTGRMKRDMSDGVGDARGMKRRKAMAADERSMGDDVERKSTRAMEAG
jgi:hypothetical protein